MTRFHSLGIEKASYSHPPLSVSGVKFYNSRIFQMPQPTIISSAIQTMLETGTAALWNQPRQLNDVNTRSQHFSVLDPLPASVSRHQYCLLLPLNS